MRWWPNRRWVTVAIAAAVVSSCSSAHGSSISVEGIVRATSAASTAHVAWSEMISSGNVSGTGDLDFGNNRYSLDVALTGSLVRLFGPRFEAVGVANHEYVKNLGIVGWCKTKGTTSSNPGQAFGVDPTSVLGSLRPPATLQRVGTETVRGVATTYYRVVHGSAWNEVWVDATDHLRRARSHQGVQGATITVEFFDYGARFAPINAPVTSRPC